MQPWFLLAWPFVGAVYGIQSLIDRRRVRLIAGDRQGESLCSFVRSFDYRATDTWILRATYEQLQPLVGFPLRKCDDLYRDLRLDGDDVDDIAEEIASRTGRPLAHAKDNPYYGRVKTVADLVSFFGGQPKKGLA
jgi:hypothetical protein